MSTTISGDTGIDKFEGTTIAGHVIQVANYTPGSIYTGTTIIPLDDTIPQITEGTQVMSLAFTPKKANSKLKITVMVIPSPSVNSWVTSALFRDSNSDAIGTCFGYLLATTSSPHFFISYINAVNTNITTFTVRIGSSSGTLTFNGAGGVAYMGGTLASSITIEEIAQ